jgi:hypothetical protein
MALSSPSKVSPPMRQGEGMMARAVPVFYDCEASSLDGVPIEIGWAFADAKTGAVTSEGHLIRPPPDWSVQESWDPAAEALHGISLVHLRAHGRAVWEIAQRMNNMLDGRELFSDSPLDEVWLRCLFEEAGLDPSFTIRRMDAQVLIAELAANRGLYADAYVQAKAVAARLAPRMHRAEADARYLVILWNAVARKAIAPK